MVIPLANCRFLKSNPWLRRQEAVWATGKEVGSDRDRAAVFLLSVLDSIFFFFFYPQEVKGRIRAALSLLLKLLLKLLPGPPQLHPPTAESEVKSTSPPSASLSVRVRRSTFDLLTPPIPPSSAQMAAKNSVYQVSEASAADSALGWSV